MNDAARFFKVLADEARLQILWLLSNHDELCVCDIMVVLDITQSKASRHLLTLKHAGLVRDRKDGLWSHYSLCAGGDELARAHLDLLRRSLGKRADAAQVLRTLRRWMARKHPVATRTRGGACLSPRKPVARRRAESAAAR